MTFGRLEIVFSILVSLDFTSSKWSTLVYESGQQVSRYKLLRLPPMHRPSQAKTEVIWLYRASNLIQTKTAEYPHRVRNHSHDPALGRPLPSLEKSTRKLTTLAIDAFRLFSTTFDLFETALITGRIIGRGRRHFSTICSTPNQPRVGTRQSTLLQDQSSICILSTSGSCVHSAVGLCAVVKIRAIETSKADGSRIRKPISYLSFHYRVERVSIKANCGSSTLSVSFRVMQWFWRSRMNLLLDTSYPLVLSTIPQLALVVQRMDSIEAGSIRRARYCHSCQTG